MSSVTVLNPDTKSSISCFVELSDEVQSYFYTSEKLYQINVYQNEDKDEKIKKIIQIYSKIPPSHLELICKNNGMRKVNLISHLDSEQQHFVFNPEEFYSNYKNICSSNFSKSCSICKNLKGLLNVIAKIKEENNFKKNMRLNK